MGRPLQSEYTKSIAVHYYAETGKAVKKSTLVKQVGYNKYVVADGTIVRLTSKEDAQKDKEKGMGYVVVTDSEGKAHSMSKLTKNVIECFDGARFHFDFVLVTDETGKVTGIELAKNAPATIEGVAVATEEDSSADDSSADDSTAE